MIWLWIIVGGIVGAMIGEKKKDMAKGFVLGLFFGPLGWLVMALSDGNLKKCPECMGLVPDGARRCKHCGVQFCALPKPIRFICPACSEGIEAEQEFAGEKIECATCQRTVPVPMESTKSEWDL